MAVGMVTEAAVEWKHVGVEDQLGGRMISAGYLQGKTVLVDCRDYGNKECIEHVRALQNLWASYKTKPFVLLGSHRGEADAKKIERIVKGLGITYPVYKSAALGENEPQFLGNFLYLVDETGRVIFTGTDEHRASGVLASLLMATAIPTQPKAFMRYLDFELENLPGRGLLRLREFREKFPEEAKAYEERWEQMKENRELKKLAKLVSLAAAVKDRDQADGKQERKITPQLIEKAIEKFSSLKESSDPRIVQEAKNALAELKWAQADL